MNRKDLAKYIDHTKLSPNAGEEEIRSLCDEALERGCASVCVNSGRVKQAHQMLEGEDVDVCSVVGFPLGASLSEVKANEANLTIEQGAGEVDMVINVGLLLDGDYESVREDIEAVRKSAKNATLKVILETGFLSDDQKIKGCEISEDAGADFVKTSTGFGPEGATIHDVKLMDENTSNQVKVKASGGIHWYEDALAMIDAGASRIGASATEQILKDAPTS